MKTIKKEFFLSLMIILLIIETIILIFFSVVLFRQLVQNGEQKNIVISCTENNFSYDKDSKFCLSLRIIHLPFSNLNEIVITKNDNLENFYKINHPYEYPMFSTPTAYTKNVEWSEEGVKFIIINTNNEKIELFIDKNNFI